IHAAGGRWRGLQRAQPVMGVHFSRVRAMLVSETVVANGALGTLGHADEERCSRQGKHYYEGSHFTYSSPVGAEEGRGGLSGSYDWAHRSSRPAAGQAVPLVTLSVQHQL